MRKLEINAGPGELSWRLVRADGHPAEVVAFEEAVVSFFLVAANLLGIPKSVAAIYGICFSSPEPLGHMEILERLDISAGSISQGLRVLREVGALKTVISPLDKRERYEPDLELRKLITHYLEHRVDKQLDSSLDLLQSITKALPPGRSSANRVLRGRVKALHSWNAKARAVLPVMKTLLKLT